MKLTRALPRTPTPILISRFARLEAGAMCRKVARAFGFNTPRNISLDDIRIPDTSNAIAATELVETCSPRFLVNHSIRTYCFGVALSEQMQLKPDLEVFYLASIMHDLGLVSPHAEHEDSFELVGADAAQAFLEKQGADREKVALVHEAIALHSSVGIAGEREPEIALVHYGAGVDVIGFHFEDIAQQTREAILQAYPRMAFKVEFNKLLTQQITDKPGCHIAGHCALGFRSKISKAPFPE